MGKIYAVRKGRNVGLFNTWGECQKQISGYSGAEFKGFKSKKEAEEYLSYGKQNIALTIDDESILKAYVDGSFEKTKSMYGSGIVILFNNKEERFYFAGKDEMLLNMRNVAGEIKASEFAMKYALDNNYKEINIYYDYEGIEKWCTGAWQAKKDGTKAYKKFYDSIADEMKVNFIKVRAHTGDTYNEVADKLAKKAISEERFLDI